MITLSHNQSVIKYDWQPLWFWLPHNAFHFKHKSVHYRHKASQYKHIFFNLFFYCGAGEEVLIIFHRASRGGIKLSPKTKVCAVISPFLEGRPESRPETQKWYGRTEPDWIGLVSVKVRTRFKLSTYDNLVSIGKVRLLNHFLHPFLRGNRCACNFFWAEQIGLHSFFNETDRRALQEVIQEVIQQPNLSNTN